MHFHFMSLSPGLFWTRLGHSDIWTPHLGTVILGTVNLKCVSEVC